MEGNVRRHVRAWREAVRLRPGAVAAVLGLAIALGCATGSPPPPESATPTAELYRVGASDELEIRVLPEPAIEREVKVRPDGRFSFDLIGDVDAGGRTTAEIEADIEERMGEFRQVPSVTVSLKAPLSNAISVLGEVKSPASFALERDNIRVSEAIARSQGPTVLAATSRVRVVRREGDQTMLYIVNLDAIQGGDRKTDMRLRQADLVYVPAAVPVVAGYNLRRALYPLEILFQTIVGPILGFLVAR
jgi:polysaccharide export outer membrane protein